ncbi:endonuclease domain-containing protein [Streptomyces sp. NPDC088360]|uniref:endonuclease domain-containing protein n=1 Tax=Streptomyces sp. NPDC088360 TaxID=3154515 RepID=UPI00344C4218
MLINRENARSLFADLTHHSMVPLDPDELVRGSGLKQFGHVFIGDIALRCSKHKGRWMYAEGDIRRAGAVFATLPLDVGDLVDVQLPSYENARRHRPEDLAGRPDWRGQLVRRMFRQARRKCWQERPGEAGREAWTQIGANGLPGELTWEEFVTAGSSQQHSHNIAGTRPLPLLTWSGTSWLLPRAYLQLLDRWEQRQEELLALSRLCWTCGAQGPLWGGWRRSGAADYVTLCPSCSHASFRPYTGELRGVLYASPRRRGTRADAYLCQLCRQSPASSWDHCHDHGYVRGPLCSGCNIREGLARPSDFLQQEQSVSHLLECRGCRTQQTLPHRFHQGVLHAHLQQAQQHAGCRCQPLLPELNGMQGVYRFEVRYGRHWDSRWTTSVTEAEAAALVQNVVNSALGTKDRRSTAGTG